MSNKRIELPNILGIDVDQLENYRQMGIIDEIALRDLYLKQEFERRIKALKGKRKSGDIILDLISDYGLTIGAEAVEKIVYRKMSRRKEFTFIITLAKESKKFRTEK